MVVSSFPPPGPPKPTPMGMDKSGIHSLSNTVVIKVTGWVARSGFPATVITSDSMVVDVSGTISITGKMKMTLNAGTQQWYIYRNAALVGGPYANNVENTMSLAVTAGDTIEMRARGTDSSVTNRRVQPAPDTYLYFTPV